MAPQLLSSVNITILGSASAQPSSTRNHSALALRLNGDVWLFDCGEATQHRIQKSNVKMGKIKKIFITHTHGDHIFGLLPLMASCLDGSGGMMDYSKDARLQPDAREEIQPLEIYGPLGTRAFIRTGIVYSYTNLGAQYVVHELRLPTDPPEGDFTTLPMRWPEQPGRNIVQTNGIWKDIFRDEIVSVSAASIRHSVPCIGFVVDELPIPGKINPKDYVPHLKRTNTPMSVMKQLQQGMSVELADGTVLFGPPRRPGRKLAILGDTCDPSPIADLAADADLLVHEATNAHLPGIDPNTKPEDSNESVEARTRSRGHSTPQMAGAFGKRTRAKKLLLNHFSARYAGNDDVDEEARKIMEAIRELAMQEYDGPVVCARDFMSFDVELQS
ncbi:Metallo-hydrolase/oxidoreductase [Daedalea quercina L-15889]|uniref:Metallo-hydrolase/oxidoreductase n=1 Tax=Daedalea quercina L-15889 TaxID=1314783 RepID=A0A165MRL4_9APHY|nr:Metallo-hydrolase/oxidoreductase [Daedalea quercina L-15889]